MPEELNPYETPNEVVPVPGIQQNSRKSLWPIVGFALYVSVSFFVVNELIDRWNPVTKPDSLRLFVSGFFKILLSFLILRIGIRKIAWVRPTS